MTNDFPSACKAFLSAHISSVSDLEVILLLYEHRDRSWTAPEVGKTLATNSEMAVFQLQRFGERGLLVMASGAETPVFQYRPNAQFDSAIESLSTLYAEKPVRVIAEIYSAPKDSVRTFADSFRLRKDK